MMNKSITHRQRYVIYSSLVLILLGKDFRVYSQEIKQVGTSAAAFLRIPVGAKGIAMGGAFTAVADDGSAMFWNPGTIATQSKRSLFVHHSPWLPGLGFYYVGFALPLEDFGVIGINVVSLKTDAMEVTTPAAPMGTGETFTAASTAVGVVFSKSLTDRFSIGANLKYVNERIFHSSATAFAFDLGTMFVTPFRNIRFGVSVSNVGTKMQINGEDLNTYVDVAPTQGGNSETNVAQLKTDRFDLPIIMRIGVAWDLRLSEGSRVTFACDGVNPNDNGQSLNLGLEYATFKESLVLRGGFSELFLDEREKGLALGAGLKIPYDNTLNVAVGYAYEDYKYLGGVNHVSVEIVF